MKDRNERVRHPSAPGTRARSEPRAHRRHGGPLVLLLIASFQAACGNVTAGGVTGEAEVYMSGDADGAPATVPSASSVEGETSPPAVESPLGVIVGAGLEGEVQVTATFYLRTIGGSLIELTPEGAVTTTVDLGGVEEPRVAREVVPGGSYEGLRVVFSDVVADVTAGLEIAGILIEGAVTVDVGDGLVVDRDLPVTIDADQPVAFLVDLNAAVWLDLLDPVGRTVAGADFASAVEVTVR